MDVSALVSGSRRPDARREAGEEVDATTKAVQMRGTKITSAKEFKPNPSKYACQYCPYKDSEASSRTRKLNSAGKPTNAWLPTVPGQSKVTTKAIKPLFIDFKVSQVRLGIGEALIPNLLSHQIKSKQFLC